VSDAPREPLRRRRDAVPPTAPEGRDAEAILRPSVPDLDAVGDAVAPSTPAPAPRIEAASPDVAVVPAASRIPGAPKEGYHQLPTAPVITSAPEPVDGESVEWTPPDALAPAPRRPVVAAWALGVAVVALAASLFVGWMLPLALVAGVAAIVALRRPREPRAVAVWALVLSAAALLFSAGWLVWALPQL
jgi:hypothetical protein